MNTNLISYYKDRAKEYEKIYCKPERQNDLMQATELIEQIFKDKHVLEIACGTGYWTERIAKTAKTILATDINDTVIEIAKSKTYKRAEVTFLEVDLFKLTLAKKYECLFGGFIWSHIKLEDLDNFINTINKHVAKGGTIVFIDNNYVQGSSLPISEKDDKGNTYQIRQLDNGSTHRVLKNFPTAQSIRDLLSDKAINISIFNLKHYWILQYTNHFS